MAGRFALLRHSAVLLEQLCLLFYTKCYFDPRSCSPTTTSSKNQTTTTNDLFSNRQRTPVGLGSRHHL